jgi:hypothetical protein
MFRNEKFDTWFQILWLKMNLKKLIDA